jgi:hypothetical protein
MATVTAGYTWTSGETVTPAKLNSAALPTVVVTDGEVTAAKLASAVQQLLVPAGAVQAFARSTAPSGWLAANGSTIGSASSGATSASADYSALFAVLWDNWTNTDLPILDSAGAASTRGASASADFAANKRLPLPDLRGIFVRGSGSQTISGITYNKTFAAKEGDAMQGHRHTYGGGYSTYNVVGGGSGIFGAPSTETTNDPVSDGTNGTPRTASETRPANIAMLYCIKF